MSLFVGVEGHLNSWPLYFYSPCYSSDVACLCCDSTARTKLSSKVKQINLWHEATKQKPAELWVL